MAASKHRAATTGSGPADGVSDRNVEAPALKKRTRGYKLLRIVQLFLGHYTRDVARGGKMKTRITICACEGR